ncbi:MAG: DNA polymerase I [Candidatus Doudnabacteria bacterium]|nr:DNA polymerase I [Candidatus Doudnabacteria bacterium]
MATKQAKKRYMLVDGNALVHRGYHAVPGLTTKTGEPVGAVYGFTMILLRAIKELKPTHIACSFDLAGPTFRHEQYAEYKGTRVKADQELYDQFPRVKEVVRALNIPIYEKQGFEADDVLGTLAHELCLQNDHSCDVMIVTGDMDTLQLVNDCVKVYTLKKGISDTAIYDIKAVRERYGLEPGQMIDYKALRGDPSDNIKGVKGIGEKGAIDILKAFKSIENLYKHIHAGSVGEKIKPRILQLLTEQEESARQSYFLATIVKDVPLQISIPPYEFISLHLASTVALFKDLEFRTLLDKLPKQYSPVADAGAPAEVDTAAEIHVGPEGVKQTPENFVQEYHLVDNVERLAPLLSELANATEFALDTETTSLSAVDAQLLGLSVCVTPGTAYYVLASVLEESTELQVFLKSDCVKIGHNIKYDHVVLQGAGVTLGGKWFDTMIASYLLNAGTRQHGLDALAFTEFGYQMQPIGDLIGKGKNQISMADVPPEKVSWYSCEDVDMTMRLKERFTPQLEQEKLQSVFADIEMPLIPVLADMEQAGILLDKKLLQALSGRAEIDILELEKVIHDLAGQEFNIASPKQLKEILFDKLTLSSEGNKKTKTGLSTAAGELEKMLGQHPIIEKIMQYRELTKLQSTYLLALPEMVNKKTGRIHTSYNQTIAATGRLSSTDPNLQNIPVKGDGMGSEIRKAFVAQKGYKLLSLDYSQIELRVVAHLSKDTAMMDVFRRGEDIHTSTAMGLFGVAADEVTKDMRRHAKTVNFGILYGLSAFGLSYRMAELNVGDAKEYIEKYFATYPGVKAYIEQIKAEVKTSGCVVNELGRMRKFPEIKSSQFFIRQAAERAAVNFPIQSLAADVIKVAMINIGRVLATRNSQLTTDCRMLLQVHDELVFEVKTEKVDHYIQLIKPLMEEAIKLSVPVVCEAKVGDNWGEMEKV